MVEKEGGWLDLVVVIATRFAICVLRAVLELRDEVANGLVGVVQLQSFHFGVKSDGAVGIQPSGYGFVAVLHPVTSLHLPHWHRNSVRAVDIKSPGQKAAHH